MAREETLGIHQGALKKFGRYTMTRMLIAAVVLLLGAVQGADAFNEPDGFRGVPWGSPRSGVSAQIPEMECERTSASGSCRGTVMIGDIGTKVEMLFSSVGLEAVSLAFYSAHFEIMKQIFVERYGKPTEETEEIQTGIGARYKNTILKWTGEKILIVLGRYGSDVTFSFGFIETRARYERELRERVNKDRERVNKGKKDL